MRLFGQRDLRVYGVGMKQPPRHVIVEGPDGGGKTGMVARINSLGYTTHERASSSIGGPVYNLTAWFTKDINELEGPESDTYGPWVYDRHPLISEPIYAPIARHVMPQGRFGFSAWVKAQRQRIMPHMLVVWCIPDVATVQRNVFNNANDQMPGVLENIAQLHAEYMRLAQEWAGPALWWDYRINEWPTWSDGFKGVMTGTVPVSEVSA